MVESKSFFFGLINVPMWNYLYGMTLAQIELLTSDCPIIVYDDGKKKEKKPTFSDIEEVKKRWEKKKEVKKNNISIDLAEFNK